MYLLCMLHKRSQHLDSTSYHSCRLILQLKHITDTHPEVSLLSAVVAMQALSAQAVAFIVLAAQLEYCTVT
jgi:hypothetical protein